MPQPAFHLSLNVANLEHSVGFYRLLLGCEPAKWFPDYAKFELSDPAVVLALEPAKVPPGGSLNHIGIRVTEKSQIDAYESRLQQVGVVVQRINEIECCYSRQSKIIFRDPDQNLVEIYTLEGDSNRKVVTPEVPLAAQGSAGNDSWEHLVGNAYGEGPPKGVGLAEVRLRGTFNHQEEFDRANLILSNAREALKPGGQLLVHLLVGNQPLTQKMPPLPPPADQVRFVPTESQVIQAIERAGFAYLQINRLSHSPVMRLGGCELRELLVHAKSPYETAPTEMKEIIYKGPFRKLEDDRGRVFNRGERLSISKQEIEYLDRQGWLADFVILN